MKRRNVLLAVIALCVPLGLAAQTTGKVYRIGYLDGGLPSTSKASVEALRQGLKDLGYVEGRNFVFDFRWGEGRSDRLAELAAELVQANADIIVTSGEPAIRAVRQATGTTPI